MNLKRNILKERLNTIYSILSRNKERTAIASILIFFLLYAGGYFIEYLSSPVLDSWDGTFHQALSYYYSQNIFPRLFGWVPNFYLGMPWPIGYPPFFHYLFALLYRLSPLEPSITFKYFFVLLTLVSPLVIFYILRKLRLSILASWLSTIFFLFYLMMPYQLWGDISNTIGGTLSHGGAYVHFVSFLISFFWLYAGIRSLDSNKHIYSSAFLFAIVFNTDIPMAQSLLPMYLYILLWIVIKDTNRLRYIVGANLLALGFISFWFVPYLTTNLYFPRIAFDNPKLLVVTTKSAMFLVPATFLLILYRKKVERPIWILFFGTLVTLIFTVVPFVKIIPNIPLQQFRNIPQLQFYCALLSGYAVFVFIKDFSHKKKVIILSMLFGSISMFIPPLHLSYIGNVNISEQEKNLIRYISNKTDGRSVFELGGRAFTQQELNRRINIKHKGYPISNILSAEAGSLGDHETIWSVFRESSFLSPFVVPIRNAFSYTDESFGVECLLCNDNEFYEQSFQTHIERARYFGIKYFIVDSSEQTDRFSRSSTVQKTGEYSQWRLYEMKEPVHLVERLSSTPILVFTKLKPGKRDYTDSLDWIGMQEQWLYQGNTQILFAHAKNQYLDEAINPTDFKAIVIVDYSYKNLEKAKKQILDYSSNGYVFLAYSQDPLYEDLKNQQRNYPNIIQIHPQSSNRNTYENLYKEILKRDELLNDLSGIQTVSKEKNSIQFIDNENTIRQWYLIKYSYFPWWTIEDSKSKIYMASPGFMLLKNHNLNSTSLTFSYPWYVHPLVFVTVISAIFPIVYYWKLR